MTSDQPPDPTVYTALLREYVAEGLRVLRDPALNGLGKERTARMECVLREMDRLAREADEAAVGNLLWLSDALDASAERNRAASAKLVELTGSASPQTWASYMEALALQVLDRPAERREREADQ